MLLELVFYVQMKQNLNFSATNTQGGFGVKMPKVTCM